MKNEAEERCKMYNLQYSVSGTLSLFVSIYILLKRPKTLALKSLFLFGLVTSLWEFSSFLSKVAPDATAAADLYKITLLTAHLCFPLYLFTILTIQEKRNRKILLLSFIPAVIQIGLMFIGDYFSNYEFFQTELGWSYRVVSYRPSLIVTGVIFIGYLAGIIVI